MRSIKYCCVISITLMLSLVIIHSCKTTKSSPEKSLPATGHDSVLVFSKTTGYNHKSIAAGAAAIMKLGLANNFIADTSSDAGLFTNENLKKYRAIVFLNTTMNVLNADQQVAFERYIQAGNGFMGIHSATDTEYDWPWYNKLVGAYFQSHPRQQKATIKVTDSTHQSTSHLPRQWERFDEWYNFKNVQPDIKVVAWLDETTYEGGTMGDKHPFAWYHDFDGGRSFYTAGGHTDESYSDSLFLRHLLGGLKYSMGDGIKRDYSKSYSIKSPEDNRFTKTILSDDLNEPMELAVAPDGRVFFTERTGKLYVYLPVSNTTKILRQFPVKAVDKYLNGLIGVTLDPDFSKNNNIYFFYTSSTGDKYHQNVSRFTLTSSGDLDTTSEKIIIKIPIDLEVSAHTGGSLAWDKNNNLYISTGDNTVPFESDGYAPIDERSGRLTFDAQRSASNTNDLRGKILRIHPEPDGTYTIPDGNLFPVGTAGTRPEIYVMGCRNPYRISVDSQTSIVYWGEVGPDAGRDSRHGPRGYDEINRAGSSGNYGWPYFVGNNQAYKDSNFATREIGELFVVNAPKNNSPNNTGLANLPSPRSAMIWYPYNVSSEFPLLGEGGRCAMSGPVYHFNANLPSPGRLPSYYDGALFIYDWMRNWVFAVRMDEKSNFQRLEPFMATNGDFRRPVDMEIGPDGVMYMLEYGSVYGIDNTDARLVKITYNAGNRKPVAIINAEDSTGMAPVNLKVNAGNSYDYDDEPLQYEWSVNNRLVSNGKKAVLPLDKNGVYTIILKVTDSSNACSSDTMKFIAGNTPPVVTISSTDNSTFFFPGCTEFNYNVQVSDKEENTIDYNKIKVTRRYIPRLESNTKEQGHQLITADYNLGKKLVAASDCKACHQLTGKSVGPAFMEISKKYRNNKDAPGFLSAKIITGGGGVWGEHAMSAHPQLSKEDATEMANYVISLSNQQKQEFLPAVHSLELCDHLGTPAEGRYIFTASYTDHGNGWEPLTGKSTLLLRPSKVRVEDADFLYNLSSDEGIIHGKTNGAYFILKKIDLKNIHQLTYRLLLLSGNAQIEVHVDSPKGKIISTLTYKGSVNTDFRELNAPVEDPGGLHDLYFVFRLPNISGESGFAVDWVQFEGGRTTAAVSKKEAGTMNDKKNVDARPKITSSPVTTNAEKLMMKSDCNVCHAQDKKIIGPSYKNVSQKYKNNPSTISMLADKIINGGSGNWGEIPMTPHPQFSRHEAMQIVKFILTQKK